MVAKIRRYQSPDEYPFTSPLPDPILPPLDYPLLLHPKRNINVNKQLYDAYLKIVLPKITQSLPDKGELRENYGSSALCDVECLQSLSRRIHFGKFVAEVKFRQDQENLTDLIISRDRKGLEDAITDSEVERRVLERLRAKAEAYGRDPWSEDGVGNGVIKQKVDVAAVVEVYQHVVIPLTKQVEVDYLLARLD